MERQNFSAKIGQCSISLGLDRRKKYGDNYRVAIKYVIGGKTLYYPLTWRVSENEFEKIAGTSRTRGRMSKEKESFGQLNKEWTDTFNDYRKRLKELSRSTTLTLDLIRASLTGISTETSFLGVWREVIANRNYGTAASYEIAMKSFIRSTGFSEKDGFNVSDAILHKWKQKMTDEGKAKATMGIYLRSCRVIVNECIRRGYILPSNYPFSEKDINKVSVPRGKDRKHESLNIEQMTELYNIFVEKRYPEDWNKDFKNAVHNSLGLFLFMYLANGMNLADLARLTYNDHYIKSNGTSLKFNRTKTKDRTDNESEVIVPIIEPLRYIMDEIAEPCERHEKIFPNILGNVTTEKDIARKVQQANQNTKKHIRKLAKTLGWVVEPSPTWCRHSFATNLAHQGVPTQYISESMGHSGEKSVTMGYISMFPHEKQVEFNSRLLNLSPSAKADDLTTFIAGLSAEDKAKLIELLTKKGG